jgi:hypothetical protein
MQRGSNASVLSKDARRNRPFRPRVEARDSTRLTLVHGEGDPPEVRHLRSVHPADLVAACRTGLLRVAFARGEVQLAGRGADLTLDITAKHFDVAGYPRREHASGTLTRVETQRLVAALAQFLASGPSTPEEAARYPGSVSNET